MKKLIVVFFCFLASTFLGNSVSRAGMAKSLHVEWGYTPPSELKLIGFKLYQEGGFVGSWSGTDINSGDITCVLVKEITRFTLTAEFADGTESPHSAPFAFVMSMRPEVSKNFRRIASYYYQKIPLKPENFWPAVVPYGPEQYVLTVRKNA